MKYFKILTILLFSSVLTFTSCKDDKTEASETSTDEVVREPLRVFDAQNQQNNSTAQSTSGVFHYTCSNGCSGGAAAAGNCSTCGSALAHNQAYHSNNNNTNTPATTPTNPAATPTPEPSQNTAGVWHYTCSQGCSGGAGSAVACSSCGNTLAHNSAYH